MKCLSQSQLGPAGPPCHSLALYRASTSRLRKVQMCLQRINAWGSAMLMQLHISRSEQLLCVSAQYSCISQQINSRKACLVSIWPEILVLLRHEPCCYFLSISLTASCVKQKCKHIAKCIFKDIRYVLFNTFYFRIHASKYIGQQNLVLHLWFF